MEPINITLKEKAGKQRTAEPVQLGVPIAKGRMLESKASTHLYNPSTNSIQQCQTSPLAYWQDGSIRWLKVNFLADVEANSGLNLELRSSELSELSEPAIDEPTPLVVHRSEKDITIDTGSARFRVAGDQLRWSMTKEDKEGAELLHEICLTDEAGENFQPCPDTDWQIIESGPLSVTLKVTATWKHKNHHDLARFYLELRFYAENATVEIALTIHNPRRAHHPGGLWDLGDPGSLHFRSLSLRIRGSQCEKVWLQPEPGQEQIHRTATEGLRIHQESSGGENWDSQNHVNAQGDVTLRYKGYQVTSGEKRLTKGDRASPVLCLEGPDLAVQAAFRKFWQNFPSAITADNQDLIVSFFPECAELYELQGGEQKTQTAWLQYSNSSTALGWTRDPLIPTLDPGHYEQTGAFPWFKAGSQSSQLNDLVQSGIEGPGNFFAKREIIDEYGWRHFGDIFADHETLYQNPDAEPFISHYNNQYDPIYGFARQFALTGDKRWFELMDDLARHVTDIDIYHTEQDRAEYNHGLFWHTDHYLDAKTASHRTFSGKNPTSSTPGQTGGGPSEEHCYTTGLMYHYLLTGSEKSLQAVMELAGWILTQREGDLTLLGQLNLAKRRDIPRLKAVIKGVPSADRHYPLSRGTGNYLNTLLDAYELTLSDKWLNQAEKVIVQTVHPSDNLSERELQDTEKRWSYLVFLSSLSRFITLKLELGQHDSLLEYAYCSFTAYIEWIFRHEEPFLANPDRLEFPNATWAAQDFRKAALLYQAAALIPEKSANYYNEAESWTKYVSEHLASSNERSYARIQIILLQNFGPHIFSQSELSRRFKESLVPVCKDAFSEQQPPLLNIWGVTKRVFYRVSLGLKSTSLPKELTWLKNRLGKRKC